jgi:deoxyguanosine kinase
MQNKIILSLGSNLGNKKQLLEQAIEMIHENVGTVIRVSNLYETPSWGFDGKSFFNLVLLMHSSKSAPKILSILQKIEKKLGRQPKKGAVYENRPIDIDIIFFNNEVIELENLEIPHPQMQFRKFVLQPMIDIETSFTHPKLKKNIAQLLKDCMDDSDCIFVEKLKAPAENLKLKQYNYIAIEGNIGAGKTTLATKIAQDFNAKSILERFADNPFLPKFYKDQNRYAFPLEMSFLADRYQQLSDDLAQFDLFSDFVVADYHIFKSLIFAKVTLAEDEFRLYKTMFDIVHKEMPKPDLYVYLYQNTEKLLANIKKRGRTYEQEIPSDYLEKINQGYLDYIKQQLDLNVLIVDVSNRDFVKNQTDYIFVLNEIEKKLAFKK